MLVSSSVAELLHPDRYCLGGEHQLDLKGVKAMTPAQAVLGRVGHTA